MTEHLAAPSASPRPALPWVLVLGLASLSLLWPLTALWGFGQGAARALMLLTLTGAVWVSVVGIGRVRRPVLTLTLTGILYGLLLLGLGGVLAGQGPVAGGDGTAPGLWRVLILLPSLAMDAGVGALLGVVALGVQRLLGPRPDGTGRHGGTA